MADYAVLWSNDWVWALPLIFFTLVLHVMGLAFINQNLVHTLEGNGRRSNKFLFFAFIMGVTTLLATLLHALEAAVWAWFYRWLGAMPDYADAMLYSLGAITTYGHADIHLAPHWRLMGALEALNGLLLFGVTTAFLYGHLQRAWPTNGVEPKALRHRHSD